ncbi:MAG: hypothetical protein K0R55_110 [Sporomusa sp.]|jgi:hypothetical protein|nr:hypothetical protein [Sporomusa sp.]
MVSTFSSKLYAIRRIIGALIKIKVIMLPLIVIVYFCYGMAAIFSKIILLVGVLIKYIADRDIVLRMMWTGLTIEPQNKKHGIYIPERRKVKVPK